MLKTLLMATHQQIRQNCTQAMSSDIMGVTRDKGIHRPCLIVVDLQTYVFHWEITPPFGYPVMTTDQMVEDQ